ncbi:hypothetical protein ABZS78_16770, partial [Streptomyces decoyicus]
QDYKVAMAGQKIRIRLKAYDHEVIDSSAAAHPGSPLPPAVPAAAPWLLLAAHVVVGLLAAGWLHRGDAALDALLRAAAAGAFRPLLTAVAVATAALTPPRRRIRPLHPLPPARPLPLLLHCVLRRGPPRPAAA